LLAISVPAGAATRIVRVVVSCRMTVITESPTTFTSNCWKGGAPAGAPGAVTVTVARVVAPEGASSYVKLRCSTRGTRPTCSTSKRWPVRV
jgi:hypothetical protein